MKKKIYKKELCLYKYKILNISHIKLFLIQFFKINHLFHYTLSSKKEIQYTRGNVNRFC